MHNLEWKMAFYHKTQPIYQTNTLIFPIPRVGEFVSINGKEGEIIEIYYVFESSFANERRIVEIMIE